MALQKGLVNGVVCVVDSAAPTVPVADVGADGGDVVASNAALLANFGTGVITFLTTPSSVNFAAAVTGETGTGAIVFGTSPTLAAPNITGTMVADTGTFSGNLTVDGNLLVSGTTVTHDTDNLVVEDPLIKLAKGNTSTHVVDIGLYGVYDPSGTDLYTGMFFDATDSKWKLFNGLQAEPTTTVNTAGTGYTAATLVVGFLEGSLANATGLPQAGTVGLTTADSPQFAGVNIGHASDTTLTRLAAGVVGIEGVRALKGYTVVSDANTAITLSAATHANKQLNCTATGGAITVTIDGTNGCVEGDDGIIVQAHASNTVTVTASTTTFQPAGDKSTVSQWDVIYWKCTGTNTFLIIGGQIEAADVANVAKIVELPFVLGDSSGAVATGLGKPKPSPVDGNIIEVIVTRSSPTSGTTTIDLCYRNDGTLPVAGDTICASDKVSIATTAVRTIKTSFTGWSLGVVRGALITPDVEANNDSDYIHISILIQPTE